jgi:hypothetical protein
MLSAQAYGHDACATGKGQQRFDRHLGPQPHVERVQDFGRTLECDTEILVSLIATEDGSARLERNEGAIRGRVRRSVRGQSLINRLNTKNF